MIPCRPNSTFFFSHRRIYSLCSQLKNHFFCFHIISSPLRVLLSLNSALISEHQFTLLTSKSTHRNFKSEFQKLTKVCKMCKYYIFWTSGLHQVIINRRGGGHASDRICFHMHAIEAQNSRVLFWILLWHGQDRWAFLSAVLLSISLATGKDGHASVYPLGWLSRNSFLSFKAKLSAAYLKRWEPFCLCFSLLSPFLNISMYFPFLSLSITCLYEQLWVVNGRRICLVPVGGCGNRASWQRSRLAASPSRPFSPTQDRPLDGKHSSPSGPTASFS